MKNFKLLFLLMLGMFVALQSCDKKELQTEKEKVIEEVGISQINDEYEGQFKKEFTVSDNNGNTAFFVAYSKNKDELNEFVDNTELSLNTNNVNIESIKQSPENAQNINNPNKSNFNEDDNNGITIELVTTNLKNDINGFSLNIKESFNEKRIRTKTFNTTSNLIGVVNNGTRGFYAQTKSRNCWLCNWHRNDFKWVDRNWFNNQHYIEKNSNNYQIGIKIKYLSQYNYDYNIIYSANSLRGNTCSIGTLVSNNSTYCLVATSPKYTHAFMWPTNTGNFYYTPINTNKCPMPGTWFDGANCYVCDIPTTTYGFVIARKMYVKTEFN